MNIPWNTRPSLYIVDPETVKTVVAVCITHYKNILNTSIIKIIIQNIIVLIHNCSFIQFYTVFNNVYVIKILFTNKRTLLLNT